LISVTAPSSSRLGNALNLLGGTGNHAAASRLGLTSNSVPTAVFRMMLLDLPPEKENSLKTQAQARGLTAEQWFLQLAEQAGPAAWDMKTTRDSPDVSWEADFEEWLNGIPEMPPLSDEAISRAILYPDRW
jgi:hypothetical protein